VGYCVCLRLATCSPYQVCFAFAFGHGVWSAAKAESLRATNILELWIFKLCKAPDGCPNLPTGGSKFCHLGRGRDCTGTDCNGTAYKDDILCISCAGGPRHGCSGCRGGEMLCFTHGGNLVCSEVGCKSHRSRELGHSTQFCLEHQLLCSRLERTPFQTFRQRQVAFLVRVERWRGSAEESSDANNHP
jgi:hypothetical protein